MLNKGIGSWPARRARRTPRRVAVVHGEDRLTYGELYRDVNRLAHALRRLGVRAGDRVAYLGVNHPSFLTALFAAGTLGAVFVPLNFRLTRHEIAHQLSDSGAIVLIHAGTAEGTAAAARADVRHVITLDTRHRGTGDGIRYADLLTESDGEALDVDVPADTPCMILYTSGTTGKPKGVVLSHANVMWNAVNTLVDTDITTDEVTLVVAPLFHAAGLNMTCLPTLLKGGRVVLVPSFDAGEVLGLLESHGVTHMFGVPGMFDAMAAHPRWHQTDLSGVRLFNCGGAPVPQRTLRAYLDRGLPMGQGYGLTEAAPGVLLLNEAMAAAKPGSAGLPHFFTDVRVARADGSDTGPGERGEILVSGPNVMAGYWQDPAATDAAFTSDGWLRTGDVAVLDPDGAAAVVDRVKDMYVSGGENVYPAEVEDVLLDHPAVAQCAVIGVADERWGEVGRAFVVAEPGADPGADCLLRYLRERLAGYKVPRTVVFRPDLPRTASGKVAKNALRDAGTPA